MTCNDRIDHDELRTTTRRFLDETCGRDAQRALLESKTGFDPVVWRRMAVELSLPGLAIPEEFGGLGCSLPEVVVVMEEMGRVLYAGPYFSTVVVSATVLSAIGDNTAMADYLPAIAAGGLRMSLALTEDDGKWTPDHLDTCAVRAGDSWLLTGSKSFVLDAGIADLLLVVASATGIGHDRADGIAMFAVAVTDAGVQIDEFDTLDRTRRQGRVRFVEATARLIGEVGKVWPAVARALDFAAVALAAEQIGGARRCLETAVDYAKMRTAFGRPIGSFQAIKHLCADMWMQVESGAATYHHAADVAELEPAQLPLAAGVASAYCSAAYVKVAADNIHIHGGIGFTWEHDAHLHYRRARSSAVYLGDVPERLKSVATLLEV
jgi:alkylation response protein AidB-like acyl-CoA dehydrogenase